MVYSATDIEADVMNTRLESMQKEEIPYLLKNLES